MTGKPPAAAARAARPGAGVARPRKRSALGSTLIGIFIGIALGLGLAAGVAFYLMKSGNPYQPAVASGSRESRDPAKSGRVEPAAAEKPRFDFYKILPGTEEPKAQAKAAERPAAPDRATLERAATPDKGIAKLEDPTAQPPARDKDKVPTVAPASEKVATAEPPPRAPSPKDRFWIQAGSFSTENDADNLKAKLALSGWEATVQQATLPDKSVRYRVRLGPYDNTGELNRVKDDLAKHGVEAAVIKGQNQ